MQEGKNDIHIILWRFHLNCSTLPFSVLADITIDLLQAHIRCRFCNLKAVISSRLSQLTPSRYPFFMRQRIGSVAFAAILSTSRAFQTSFSVVSNHTFSKTFYSSSASSQDINSRVTTNIHCATLNNSYTRCQMSTEANGNGYEVDLEYPGTAVERLKNVRARVASLKEEDLNGDWEDVRRRILWAGGLRDLPNAIPGKGYTGHAFNDYNHVDLTTMNDGTTDNTNDGTVKQIAVGNFLGDGIRTASLPELGPGGSWSTCANGCHVDPPQDVAHIQFRSRIAFKLVWVPNENFDTFVLVDDEGIELARGKVHGRLPDIRQRQMNYQLVRGSKYSKVADSLAKNTD